jgi:hypothetical protein
MKLTKTHYLIGGVALAAIGIWYFKFTSQVGRGGGDTPLPNERSNPNPQPTVVSAATVNTEAQKKAEAQKMIDAMKSMKFDLLGKVKYEMGITEKTGYSNINGKAEKAVIYT